MQCTLLSFSAQVLCKFLADSVIMTYTRSQLISALHSEYEFLCHDDFDPDVDMSPSEYLTHLQSMSLDDLINETSTDDTYTLDEFMDTHYG